MTTNAATCDHGPESRRTSDGTPIGYCTDCTGERSYWGNAATCSACFVGRLHTDCSGLHESDCMLCAEDDAALHPYSPRP